MAGVCITNGMEPGALELAELRRMTGTGRARAIRLRANVSESEVAADVGVSPATISRWETGTRIPRGPKAVVYLRLLLRLEALANA